MTSSGDLLQQLLARVRRDFYAGRDDLWFPQQQMVQKALTYPARWLHEKQVPLSRARYRQIVDGILDTMLRKGNLAGVQWRSRYLLHCVQTHMEHHGDAYYTEGKGIRNRVDVYMGHLERRATRPVADATVANLAEVHQALLLGKRKAKPKPPAPALQPDLFGTAKGRKKG